MKSTFMAAYYQSVVYEEKKVTYWVLLLVLAFVGMIFVVAYLMKDVLLPWFPTWGAEGKRARFVIERGCDSKPS